MIVWGAWVWGFPGATRPTAFCARRAVMLSVFVRERAHVSGAGATAGSRPRAPTSFGVGFAPLAARYRLWFAVRASDAFSRAYPPPYAFRPCLAVYGPYSASDGGVVGAWWLLWCGYDSSERCFVASCVRIGERPGQRLGRGALAC